MAVRLGRANVDALARSITAKQFIEWEVYSRLEPFDEVRGDMRAAQITAMIFNMAVAVNDRKPIGHFLLPWDEAVEAAPVKTEQDWRFKKALAYMICTAYKAKEQR